MAPNKGFVIVCLLPAILSLWEEDSLASAVFHQHIVLATTLSQLLYVARETT